MTSTTVAVGMPERGNRQLVKAAALQVIEQRFSRVQPVWVERHLAVLMALRTQFGADIDKAIILGVIGQRMMSIKQEATVDYDTVLAGEIPALQGRYTNIESIAATSGIPRETVRRKIAELEKLGWVRRNPGGDIELTGLPAQRLDGITRITMDLLASVFETINHELQCTDASIPAVQGALPSGPRSSLDGKAP